MKFLKNYNTKFKWKKGTFCFCLFLLFFVLPHFAEAGMIQSVSSSLGLTSGLVGHWTFDNKDIYGTKLYDRSGNANTGTISGATKAIGKIGQALSFDGSDDYVTIGSPASLTNIEEQGGGGMSISAWVYVKGTGKSGQGTLVGKALGGNEWALWVNGGFYFNHYFDGGSNVIRQANSQVSYNKWRHVVMTWDGSITAANVHFYVDGVEVTSYNLTGNGSGNQGTDAPDTMYIGCGGLNARNFQGIIDDLRVYNRVLSPSEIARLYNMGQGTKLKTPTTSLTSGLVGHWTFDGSKIAGIAAYDSSNSFATGTITGATKSIGKLAQGMNFDGVDDNVNLGTPPANLKAVFEGTSNSTICSWFKFPSGGDGVSDSLENGNFAIASYGDGSSNFFVFGRSEEYSEEKLFIYPSRNWDRTRIQSSELNLLRNKFYHGCVVTSSYDATYNSIIFYLDGLSVGTGQSEKIEYPSGSYTAYVGHWAGGEDYNDFFKGDIDDVRIYNRALSADEIKRLYNMGAAEKIATPTKSLSSGLVGHWTFDGKDIYGTSALDKSGNGNTGTINGATKTYGRIGQGLNFDGNDYVALPEGDTYLNPSAGTIAFWYKNDANAVADTHFFYSFNAGGCSMIDVSFYGWNPTTMRATHSINCIGDSDTIDTTVSDWSVASSKWHFFAYTWDVSSDTLATFYDGAYQTQADNLDTGTLNHSGLDNTSIGSYKDYAQNYYKGLLDDYRIYNRALSQDELKRLYQMGR